MTASRSSDELVRRPKSSVEIYQEILGLPPIRESQRNSKPSFVFTEGDKHLDVQSSSTIRDTLARRFKVLQQLPKLSQAETGNIFILSFENSQDPLLVIGGK